MGGRTYYGYDAKGRLAKRTEADGRSFEYAYDTLGRVMKETARGTDGSISLTGYEFDENGRLSGMKDATGETRFEFDQAGRLMRKVTPEKISVEYGYDAEGKRTSMKAVDAEGHLLANYRCYVPNWHRVFSRIGMVGILKECRINIVFLR